MKISKSKQELARIISENGGWRDGAEWAAMDKTDGNCNDNAVGFFSGELRPECFGKIKMWRCRHIETVFMGYEKSIFAKKIIGNWHQSCLSRAEYFHLYPAPDADGWIEWGGGECPVEVGALIDVKYRDLHVQLGSKVGDRSDVELYATTHWRHSGGAADIITYRLHKPEQAKPEFCESVMRTIPEPEAKPTIEQLAADYRSAKDFAERKQQEADAAKADEEAKLAELVAAGTALGLVLSVAAPEPEPELVITDWRDLLPGDEVEYVEGSQGWSIGQVGVVQRTDDDGGGNMNVRLLFGDKGSGWPRKWRFIRRP